MTSQQDPARLSFGPRPDQDIPASWAEEILTKLATTSPTVFGRLLREVVLAGLNGGQADEDTPDE